VSNDEPTVLEAYIGGFGGTSYWVTWKAGAIEYRTSNRDSEKPDVVMIQPEAADWQIFWKALDGARVWKWAKNYAPREMVYDGTSWELVVRHQERKLKSGGSNAYPDNFDVLLDAVSKLLGGRDFR